MRAHGRRLGAAAVVAIALGGPYGGRGELFAYSTGIFDQAQAGCTCHGLGTNAATTRVFVFGLPDGSDPTVATGYVPGRSYPIQVAAFGLSTPPLGAGFNLWPRSAKRNAPGGDLATVDGTARLRRQTECSEMAAASGCTPGGATNACRVVIDPGCSPPDSYYDPSNPACRICPRSTPDPGSCRPCDAVAVLDVQATHAGPHAPPFQWNLIWTAPPAGTGPVTFYLAANIVNGDGAASLEDAWNTLGADPLQPLITIPEGERPAPLPVTGLPAH